MHDPLDERLCRLLFLAATDPLLISDADGLVMISNPAAQTLFGYSETEFKGTPVEALIPERLRDNHNRLSAEYLRNPTPRTIGERSTLFALRSDGTEFAAEISLTPIDDGMVLARIQDVSERRHLVEALRKYSRIIEQTASTIVITDTNGVIEYVNPRFKTTTGYSPAEVIGHRPNLLKSGHTSEEEYRQLWRTITAGNDWYGEFINRRKDGSLYWESAIISPIRDEEGRITHFAAIKDDISERKEAEEALRESEARFRATFEQAAVGIGHVAPGGHWLRVNNKLCEIVGYSREELLARTFQEITHPDDLDADLAQRRRMLAGEIDTYSMEKRYLHKNGHLVWANLTISLTRKPDGTPDYFIPVVEDIRARIEAEHARHASEKQLQLFIEHAPVALAMFDHDMRYLVVSRRWCDDYQVNSEMLIGRSHYEVFPEIPERWKTMHRRGIAGEVLKADEDRFERQDGTVQWLRWEIRPWYTSEADVGGVVLFTEDITERKETESALRERDARSQALIDTAEDGILMLDEQGYLVDVNDAYVHHSGYSREELLTMKVSDLEAQKPPQQPHIDVDKLMRHGNDRFESRHRTKNGKTWPVEISATYSEAAGRRLFVFVRDISERKRAISILRISEERYRSTLDNMLEGCQIIGFDWCFQYVNDALLRQVRQPREALIGRTVMNVFPGIENTPLYGQLHRCMTERLPLNLENHFTFPDGGKAWFALRIQPVPEGIFVLSIDITERKRAEMAREAMHAEREQMMKFQVASQTVEAIAHELNQPLTAITNYADAALDLMRAGNPEPETLREAVEGSADQARRAGRVVRELLRFLRRGEIETEPVDINALAYRVLTRAEANGSNSFQGRLELEPDLPPVRANRLQLEKVLDNLIQNGIEAMHEAGVDTHLITVTVRTCGEEGFAQITVRDNGPGVDSRVLHRLFDPFFTTKPYGLGMGLAISRAIVEAHGGQLWADPASAPGAAFHLTLPFAP